MNNRNAEDFWRRQREMDAKIPAMPRDEYLEKYPNGGPERYSGDLGPAYVEFRAAIKRRDKEARRGGWIKFWLALAGLAVLFVVVLLTAGFPQAIMTVLVLVLAYCFVEMGMNLPSR